MIYDHFLRGHTENAEGTITFRRDFWPPFAPYHNVQRNLIHFYVLHKTPEISFWKLLHFGRTIKIPYEFWDRPSYLLTAKINFLVGLILKPLIQKMEIFNTANFLRILISENTFVITLESSYCLSNESQMLGRVSQGLFLEMDFSFPNILLWPLMMQGRKRISQPILVWISVGGSRMTVVFYLRQAVPSLGKISKFPMIRNR